MTISVVQLGGRKNPKALGSEPDLCGGTLVLLWYLLAVPLTSPGLLGVKYPHFIDLPCRSSRVGEIDLQCKISVLLLQH